ncbi:stage II sporulation protein M [soil metagenome]
MILDLESFVGRERPYWEELEQALGRHQAEPRRRRDLAEVRRFHYLFERASADLVKLRTFSGREDLRHYLEQLVARAYVEVHGGREAALRFSPLRWAMVEWPRAFRRHAGAFWFAILVTVLGAGLGALALSERRENMMFLMPPQFGHLVESPSERVAREEEAGLSGHDELAGNQATFAAYLVQNNVRVALRAMAFGILYGVFTVVMLFYNGAILGAVGYDYVAAGETEFLLAWLLPHGVPELTAIFIGGQAGLVLGRAMLGWGSDLGMRARLRSVRGDLVTLAAGCVIMLLWAGWVESYISQRHEPALPYSVKIGIGLMQLLLLVAFFGFCGRRGTSPERKGQAS